MAGQQNENHVFGGPAHSHSSLSAAKAPSQGQPRRYFCTRYHFCAASCGQGSQEPTSNQSHRQKSQPSVQEVVIFPFWDCRAAMHRTIYTPSSRGRRGRLPFWEHLLAFCLFFFLFFFILSTSIGIFSMGRYNLILRLWLSNGQIPKSTLLLPPSFGR